MFKKKNSFLKTKKEIDKHLKNRKLDSAIALYNKLNQAYQNLKDKEIHEKEFIETRDKLILILKIEELQEIVKTNKIEEIKKRLNEIELATNQFNDLPERFLNFIKHNYNHAYKIYHYKLYKVQLDDVIQEIYNFLTEQNYEQALYLIPETMHHYNEMSKYYRNDKIAAELEELKQHIKLSILKQRAVLEPAEVDTKILKKAIKEKQEEDRIQTLPELPKLPEQKISPQPKLTKLKNLIKKGDPLKAKRELNETFTQ